ncbi:glycosyltransferase family 4 protein [Natrinema sp. LN54]|uniref:glycosyltransferase family 4 protein n=1 Tax=Natrinema sp. LN54 TaxID=3458705 RepID=UPI004036A6F9
MDGLHLTTAHKPTDTRIFDKEATSLASRGFDIGIMAHETPGENRNGVRFHDLQTATNRVERWRSLTQVARQAKQLDSSIYHFHDPELIPIGLYLATTTDSAVIYDVHEDYGHVVTTRNWIPGAIALPLSYSIPRLEQLAAARFDAIVAVSEWIGEPFTRANDNVTTIHNFPKTDFLPSDSTEVERTADHVLCYVGGLEELRGIYRMLELLDLLIDRGLNVELWALGPWTSDQRSVERFIRQRNLEQHVRFPGYLEYDEMFRYLHSADVGLALLDTEHYQNGIPTKLFEYLYAGLPIVTTPVDAVAKFMPEQYCHVVPQGDTAVTADAVEEALATEYDTETMQSLVESEYSWEAEAESLAALYDELI